MEKTASQSIPEKVTYKYLITSIVTTAGMVATMSTVATKTEKLIQT